MDKKPLHQHVQNLFEDVRLSEAQLKKLKALQDKYTYDDLSKASGFSLPSFSSFYVNGLVACIVFLLSFILFAGPTDMNKTMAEDISLEVVSNHILLKPLEVTTSRMGEIKKSLGELQFTPIVSKVFDPSHGRLLGGRYCSIKRALAVQLRYETGDGKSSTLYETSYTPETFSFLPDVDKGEEPLERQLKGLRVRLWVEQGLVFASVTE